MKLKWKPVCYERLNDEEIPIPPKQRTEILNELTKQVL